MSGGPNTWMKWRAVLVAVVMAIAGLAVSTAPASAAPPAPEGLAPSESAVSGIPVLSWARVAGATSYDVEVAGSSAFSPVLSSVSSTVNLQFVPTSQLPTGDVWWRVRARDASGTGAWTTTKFSRSSVAGPALLSPDDGRDLLQPDEPAALSWTPVDGAMEYVVEISTDQAFIDPNLITTYKTKTSSFVLPSPQLATTYYWRVRAALRAGVHTDYSTPVRSYRVRSLSPAVRRAPGFGQPDDAFPEVDDAVLDWDPVAGAKTYDLQIDTDISFSTPDHEVLGVTGTSYARPQTLNNDQYYWRVRPVDVNNNKSDWVDMPIWRFQRAWDEQPALEYPGDGAVVGDPFHYEWTPVKLASSYTIELSPNASFSPDNLVARCSTVHTTYTPTRGDCRPAALGTYYWRVIAQDDFSTTTGPTTDVVAAEVHSFTYDPSVVTLLSPANGAQVQVPTLEWQPLAGAAKYKVSITSPTGTTSTYTTAATSYTPRSLLEVDKTYRWQVQPVSQDGRVGSGTLIGSQRSFTVIAQTAADASSPEPTTGSSGVFGRFPTLSWTPVLDATSYRLFVRPANTVGFTQVTGTFAYPAGEDLGTTYLSPGEYEWIVEAYGSSGFIANSSSPGRFTIAAPAAVTGHRVALTGADLRRTLGTGQTPYCAATLPNECQNLRHTPVLTWDASPDAGYYRVYLSHDREMTNIVTGYPVEVNNTEWIPTSALPDSQAGSAYYWLVRPCTADGYCRPLEYAGHAFNKLSNRIELLGPEHGATRSDDITFSWRDYLETNTLASPADTALTPPARTEARRYQIQVSTDPSMQSAYLDDTFVDQTSFTSFANTYPEGPVYWRVRAFDGSNNPLPWSETRQFTKLSPVPVPTTPVSTTGDLVEVSGNVRLFWTPLDFAASYDVEINKVDTNPANTIVSKSTKQATFSLDSPLAASSDPYMWRVRRVDAKNRKGDWSSWQAFMVVGTAPALTSPADGAQIHPSESLFTWEPRPGETPTSYRFERAKLGSSTITEAVPTAARAYAPRSVIPQGDWQWRVTTLDAAGNPLGTSPWQTFVVFSGPQATTPPVIDGSGKVGTVLAGTTGTWDQADVTETYQWFRGTTAVTGATGLTYEVTSADLGNQLKLRVTGAKPGWSNTVVDSNTVAAASGDAALAERAPVISGSGKVGSTLTSESARWDLTGVTEKYQWLRDGQNIYGANASTYTVTTADIGTSLRLKVTATKPGHGDGIAYSNAIQGLLGDGPVNTAVPTITGTRSVGNYLSASSGTWEGSLLRFTYQWLRNGVVISGATGSSYRLATPDAAQAISVRVTASKTGYVAAQATSASARIAKLPSRSTAALESSRIRPAQRGLVRVTVSVPGVARPVGTVQVFDGRRKIKAVTLRPRQRGNIAIRLPLLRVGKHPISTRYLGTARIAPSRSARLRLVVAR